MKQTRFKNLTYQRKKKKLLTEIQKKCGGALSEKELETIVKTLALNIQCTLELVHSSDQMQKELTLIWMTPPQDSGPAYVYIREFGHVLIGDAGFILISEDWNRRLAYPQEFTQRPSFAPDKKLIIKVEKHIISTSPPYLQKQHRIVIYLPE